MKIVPAVLISAVLVAGLAGCTASASAHLTLPKSQLATAAVKALQKAVGTTVVPKINCGSGSAPLVVGTKLNCTLIDPGDGKKYATVVTITKVKGLNYSVDAKVANTPES